ncbi:hypothetical protein SAURM35S_00075 [Streptomyces aurantiogriseus]
MAGVLVEELRLGGGDPLGDVDVAAAQGARAGGAVGYPADVDAGRLGLAAPVAVEAVERGLGLPGELGDLEGAGAGADGTDGAVLGVRLRGEDAEGGAGEPQRENRVRGLGGDRDGVGVVGLGGQRHVTEDAGPGLGLGGVVEGIDDRVGRDLGAVLERGLAQLEDPGRGVLLGPGPRQGGCGGAVLVQRGEALGHGELAEHGGVVAVRRQSLHRRHGEGDPQTTGRSRLATCTRAVLARCETAGQQRAESECRDDAAGGGAHGESCRAGADHAPGTRDATTGDTIGSI